MNSVRTSWCVGLVCAAFLLIFATPGIAADAEQEDAAPTVGLLKGSVVTAASGSPVPDAIVEIRGRDSEVVRFGKSDPIGEFSVELPAGMYDVEIKHAKYPRQTFPALAIKAGAVQQSVFKVGGATASAQAGSAIEEVVVLGTYKPVGTDARWSDSVLDVVTAQDFKVTGDSTAVEALARIPGVTIQNDKYIYVRGMGERYSNTTFNGALLPSPDPLRRIIPFDLFPTYVMETIAVQKTYSADQYGDFGGGSVAMQTRDIPDEPVRQVKVEVETNSQTTGTKALTYNGSSDDWTGYDFHGHRNVPKLIKQNKGNLAAALNDPAQQTALAQSLSQDWGAQLEDLPATYVVDGAFGQRWDTNQGAIGGLLGLRYKNDYNLIEEKRQEAQTIDGANPSVQANGPSQNYDRTIQTIDFSTLLNLEWQLNESHTLRNVYFLTRRTEKNAIRYWFFDENKGSGEDAVSTTYSWEDRSLWTDQLSGEHFFGKDQDLGVSWFAEYSRAQRDVPDTAAYVYERPGGSPADTPYVLSDDQGSLPRTWENLQDDAYGLGLNVKQPFDWGGDNTTTVEVGVVYNHKERDTSNLRFEYLTSTYQPRAEFEALRGELIGTVMYAPNLGQDKLELALNSRNTNLVAENYEGKEKLLGYFISTDTDLGANWRVSLGVRAEDFKMTSKPIVDATAAAAPSKGDLDENDVLPAATVTWLWTENMQMRFGASRTLNRPDLREVGPVRFVDPDTGYSYIGNPNLKEAKIDNYDVRWEWYFAEQDNVQIALFYKDFTDPIEIAVIPGAPVLRRPFNAESATNEGVELAFRKQLDFFDVPVMRDMYIRFNGAYIDSQVDLPSNSTLYDSGNRPLQGQSKYVVNTQLTWEDFERDIQASLLFNWSDKRTVDVGTDNLPGSEEELPPWLDFVYTQGLDMFGRHFIVNFKARNLFDENVKVTRGSVTEREYSLGRTFTFGVTAEF